MATDHEDNHSEKSSPVEQWEFAGWGTAEQIRDVRKEEVQLAPLDRAPQHKLGQWRATAICGNDITSSCLYVSALCATTAGRYAPIVLAIVAAILYLFRKVYAEVGSALPLNGGAYNVLLNTTTKAKASVAACLTLLSYIATAVISAYEAMEYAHHLYHGLPIIAATVGLLLVFAMLNILGITESAVVALGIFIFHIATLTVLVVVSAIKVIGDPTLFSQNWSQPPPGGLISALYFGFASAMLGISGFESSANFIEEQKPGVFPKTLRNMWVAVGVFNPTISLLSLGLIPLANFAGTNDLLAQMALTSWGPFLSSWVSIDAVLVLSGAVLTSYVGVTGLVRRMALDRCLPQKLLAQNRLRGTNHWIILGFFLLCWAILEIAHNNADPTKKETVAQLLAGVYTISFLGVMALFAIGNMLLKVKRSRLPRAVRAGWPSVTLGLAAVLAGISGNIQSDPRRVRIFLFFFIGVGAVIAVMFLRIQLLKIVLFIARAVAESISQVTSLTVVYFTRGDNLAALNRAAQYVLANEQTRTLKVVHVYQSEDQIPANLSDDLHKLDEIYPQLRIDFVGVQGKFGPEMIEALSQRLGVPKNYMFIGTPGDRFPHNIADLGGVRVIL